MKIIDWQAYAPGEHRIVCPSCGRSGKDKTLGLTVKSDGGLGHCFRCQYTESFKHERGVVRRAPIIQPTQKVTQKHETLSYWGRDLWSMCLPIEGVARDYLKSRRCVVPPKDSDLRWHHSLKHPSGYIGAGLVARVTDSLSGEARSLHRTWIQADGTKANVEPPRMLLGNHSLKNACIRLWSDEYVSSGLAIGEGVETCLSLAHAFEPVWATLDAGHLADFPVLAGVEVLTICRDNDLAGIKASEKCAARWLEAGHIVHITSQIENDINDILTEAAL